MKRKQKSIRKIRMLFLLLILTAVLMITATYAWFSTQKDVEVTGMRLNVEVAESMQISLDGEKWVQSIEIEDMRQFYGSHTNANSHQANPITTTDGNTNYVPTELLPVSTAGEVSGGKLQFVQGVVTNGETTKLTGITACSEDDLTKTAEISARQDGNKNHPYMVFDMYLRNISAKTTGQDDLKLNAGSKVYINTATTDDTEQEGKGVADTGLEYSARVGMIVYGNTVSVTATDIENGATVAEQIRGLSAKGDEVAAIWEPNNLNHTTYVVSNNGRGITSTSQAVTTYGIKSAVASAETKEISDVNSTTDTNLVAVNTFKPAYTTPLSGTDEATVITNTAGNNVGLAPNQISKVRVYIWLEGQDPDCIDLASTGDKLSIDLKLTKDGTNLTDKNTYTGTGIGSGGTDDTNNYITAASLYAMTEAEKKEIYGQVLTNYADSSSDAQKSVNWKIFHSDGENIYLIADDYIETQYVPTGKGNTAVGTGSYARGFSLAPYADYAGWSDISSTSVATKWLSQYVASGYTSTENNMKATAYLLDTNQWGVFKNSAYADYAIGGPTLELFTASYNAIHETDIETQVISSNGYQVRFAGGTFANTIRGLATTESLYVINDTTNAYGMWVASPSAGSAATVMIVYYDGRVYNDDYSNAGDGSRPCIFLKSNIQIEKQEDGTYKIVE